MGLSSKKFRVCVDLGSTDIKIAGISKNGKAFNLLFYDVIDLITEYSLESFSEISDDHYIEQLRKLVSKYRLENVKVSATLPANSAIIHNLKLNPAQTESELIETIHEELSQFGSQKIEEMHIACHEMDENNDENNSEEQQLSLLACAVPNSVLERYRRILQESRLKASVLDLDALGVYNAFYFFHSKKISVPVTILQIGSQYTVCLVMFPGKTPFFYVIKLGGNTITIRIMEELCLSFFKADKLKRRIFRPKWTNTEAFQKLTLSEILSEFTDNLISEVKRCLQHYQSCEGVAEIGKIYLTGGAAKMDLLVGLFFQKLKIETELWNPLNFFQQTSAQQNEQNRQLLGIHLTPTIGTLLRGD